MAPYHITIIRNRQYKCKFIMPKVGRLNYFWQIEIFPINFAIDKEVERSS